jgi:hypothetical protein
VGALDYAIRRTGVGVKMPAGQAAARADGAWSAAIGALAAGRGVVDPHVQMR